MIEVDKNGNTFADILNICIDSYLYNAPEILLFDPDWVKTVVEGVSDRFDLDDDFRSQLKKSVFDFVQHMKRVKEIYGQS